VVQLPQAPANLKASVVISEPVPKPKPRRKIKVAAERSGAAPVGVPDPDPDPVPVPVLPKVSINIPTNFTAHLDHKRIQGSSLSIKDESPHLIRLRPKNADRPEITLRLSPPQTPGGNWRAAIHSTPWMQITLNKRPAGQTPKSKLSLPRGPFVLLLKRDAVTVRLALETAE
jgi:hypothetical protein